MAFQIRNRSAHDDAGRPNNNKQCVARGQNEEIVETAIETNTTYTCKLIKTDKNKQIKDWFSIEGGPPANVIFSCHRINFIGAATLVVIL